jgi:AraC family transcriptional regulator
MDALPTIEEGLSRRLLYRSAMGRVELLVATPFGLPSAGHNRQPVFAHAFEGMFDFWLGRRHATFDSGRILQLDADREYRERHPVRGKGHRALLFVPSAGTLDRSPVLRRMFAERLSRSAGPHFPMLSARWRLSAPDAEPLALDELWCTTMAELEGGPPGGSDSILVNRAKAHLNANLCGPVSLAEVAARLRVTPNHLTQSFTRAEGIPLYRYHLGLRLQRALELVPRCDDLTMLALDLGFSSHSHFTEAFRRHFGLTPSAYRAETRTVLRAA